MGWVSEEQVAAARGIDLLTYLQQREPNELVHSAPGEYRTATHGSLVISKGKWYWNRGQFGGVSALDYLIKIRGMEFTEAIEELAESGVSPIDTTALLEEKQKPASKWTFYPPKPQRYSNRAVSYLQARGISPEVIKQAARAGIFYESRYYNPRSEYHNTAVCVFAGRNESGKIVFAALRGIDSDFKLDKAGSDKRIGFCIPAKNKASRHLAVFEAPIDALSHATLQQRNGWKWDGYRLSLGGTSDVALISFLERNPQITRVIMHLDNDVAGFTAARKIKARLAADIQFRHIRVSVNPPRRGKDYNDTLLHAIKMEQEQKQVGHRKEAGFSID